jgi:small subunit ribosomal protein S23
MDTPTSAWKEPLSRKVRRLVIIPYHLIPTRITSHFSATQFAVSLFEHHDIPLSIAYHKAAAQFRSLRAELAVASDFATIEAKFLGAEFAPSELERGVNLTKRALMTWSRTSSSGRRKTISIRNRFFPVWKGRTGVPNYWSRGVGYTKRWLRGMPPMFWPSKVELRAFREPMLHAEEGKLRFTRRRSPSVADPIQ